MSEQHETEVLRVEIVRNDKSGDLFVQVWKLIDKDDEGGSTRQLVTKQLVAA